MKQSFLLPALVAILSGVLVIPGNAGDWVPPMPQPTLPTTPFDAPEGAWTVVVLPDTQHYLAKHPEVFQRQIEWIAAHKKSHNIRFVSHEGDVTSNNSEEDWEKVKQILQPLNRAGIPFALTVGNKDLGEGGRAQDRTTRLNDYFTEADYAWSTAKGFFEAGRLENSWQTFETPWGRHLLLALEFGPRDEVVDWAGKVIEQHPDCRVMVITHACLYHDGQLHGQDASQGANPKNYEMAKAGSVNTGMDLWEKLLSKHRNIALVCNGHATGPGAARLTKYGDAGNPVHLLLANYQIGVVPDRGYGGGGYLRLLRFFPDGKTVEVKTYSPWYDDWLTQDSQQFRLTFP